MEDTNVHISFENLILILMCTIENMDFVGFIVHIKIEYQCVQWKPIVHNSIVVLMGTRGDETNVYNSSLLCTMV